MGFIVSNNNIVLSQFADEVSVTEVDKVVAVSETKVTLCHTKGNWFWQTSYVSVSSYEGAIVRDR